MPVTWGELRTQLRRTLLQDQTPNDDGAYRWGDNDDLRDYCWWALASFAQHTAVATATTFTPVTQSGSYTLPDNLYTGDRLDVAGIVYIETSSGTKTYLNPVRYTNFIDDPYNAEGFWTNPENVLHIHLQTTPGSSDVLQVEYFAYYNNPYADSDTIDVPVWGIQPLLYLMAAHAMSGAAMKSARIRQWSRKPDTGQPEHNPLREQQRWFLDLYEWEMAKHTPQNRVNHFRSG